MGAYHTPAMVMGTAAAASWNVSRQISGGSTRKRSVRSKKENEVEVHPAEGDTIEESHVRRSIGVIAARPDRTLQPTARARKDQQENEHKIKEPLLLL